MDFDHGLDCMNVLATATLLAVEDCRCSYHRVAALETERPPIPLTVGEFSEVGFRQNSLLEFTALHFGTLSQFV